MARIASWLSLKAFVALVAVTYAEREATRLWWSLHTICETVEGQRIRTNWHSHDVEIKMWLQVPGNVSRCGLWLARESWTKLLTTHANFNVTDSEALWDACHDLFRIEDNGRFGNRWPRELRFYLPIQ